MTDFSEFVNDERFQSLSEKDKPEAIRQFFVASSAQFAKRVDSAPIEHGGSLKLTPESESVVTALQNKGDQLAHIQSLRTQAEFGGRANRASYEKLMRIEADRLNNVNQVRHGAIDRSEALKRDAALVVDSINERTTNLKDTSSVRQELAKLYVLSGQSDFVDKESLTNADARRARFNAILEDNPSVTLDQIREDVAAYTGNFDGDFTSDQTGNVIAKPHVWFEDRETIINKVNASDLNKLEKEGFLDTIDQDREAHAKGHLDLLDDSLQKIYISRVARRIMSVDDFNKAKSFRDQIEGDTDAEKMENYVKALRNNSFGTKFSNIVDGQSELNQSASRVLSGAEGVITFLNPFDNEDDNKERQRIHHQGRQAMAFILNTNEGIIKNDTGIFYRGVKAVTGVLPDLAAIYVTGGGKFLAGGVSRLGGGKLAQRIALNAGIALPAATTTYFDVLAQAQNSDDPAVRERATQLAFTSAGTEQIFTTAFGSIGLGGLEDVFSKPLNSVIKTAGGKVAVSDAFKKTMTRLKDAGGVAVKGAVGEIPEEVIIQAVDSLLVQSELNPDMTVQDFKDALVETTVTSGIVGASIPTASRIIAKPELEIDASNKPLPSVEVSNTELENQASSAMDAMKSDQDGSTRTAEEEAAVNIVRTDQEAQRNDGELTEEQLSDLERNERILREEEAVQNQPQESTNEPVQDDTTVIPEDPRLSETDEIVEDVVDPNENTEQVEEITDESDQEAVQEVQEDPIPDVDIEDFRDQVFELSDEILEGVDVETKNALVSEISNAQTPQELSIVEQKIVEQGARQETPEAETDGELEQVSVKQFRQFANEDQELEFFNRSATENPVDIVTDIANRDGIDFFKDSDTVADEVRDLERQDSPAETRLYGGLSFLDPVVIKKIAENVYQAVKSLGSFSKRMVELLGNKVLPFVRNYFRDLRKNNGKVTSDIKSDVPKPKKKELSQEEQQLNDELKTAGVDPGAVSDEDSNINLPVELTRQQVKDIARNPTGSQNTHAAKLLNTAGLGTLTQIQKTLKSKFYGPALFAWHWARSVSRPKARSVSNQFRGQYGDVVQVDKEGNLQGVTPVEGGPTSLRPADVIESLMEDPYSYEVPQKFREFVAEWKRVRNNTVNMLGKEKIPQDFLFDESGKYDESKLFDNFYFPRSTVLVEGDTSPKFWGGSGTPKLKLKSSNSRQFDTEQDGVDNGFVYVDDPFARIENYLTDAYNRISDWRLVTDPDLVKNQEPLSKGFKIVSETVDLESGEAVVRTKKTGGSSKNGDRQLNIGGKVFNFQNDAASEIQRVIDRQTPVDPDSLLGRWARITGGIRSLNFVGDTSAFAVQLYYMSRYSPPRFVKTAKIALAHGLGSQSAMRQYQVDNAAIIAEAASFGSLIGKSFEDVEFINAVDGRSSATLQTLKKIISPFTRIHEAATNVGAIEMYKALRYRGLNQDGSIDPQKMAGVAQLADRLTGKESFARNGVSATAQSLLSSLSSAPSMYVAYVNVMSDIASKDSHVRSSAIKSHGRFMAAAGLIFIGQSMASMMLDPDDNRSYDQKLDVTLSRLNPIGKDFMRYEVPLGGNRTILSQGSFFRSSAQFSAKVTSAIVSGNLADIKDSYKDFLSTRKSPGVNSLLQAITNKDFFGDDVTLAEVLTTSMTPVAFESLVETTRKPVFEVIEDITGGKFTLNGRKALLEDRPELEQTMRELMFGIAGFSNFSESDSRRFKRERDVVARDLFEESYETLSAQDKRATIVEAAKRDIFRPKFVDVSGGYTKFLQNQFAKSVGDSRFLADLDEQYGASMQASLSGIPKKNVQFSKKEPKVQMGEEEFKTALDNYTRNLKSYYSSNDDIKPDDLKKEAQDIWNNELKSLGYPVKRRR